MTRNDISLEFDFCDELDKNFYQNFIKETNQIREEYDLFLKKNKVKE